MFWRRRRIAEIYPLTDDIALSPQPDERDWPSIYEQGFCAAIDLRAEAQDIGALVRANALDYMRAPIVDGAAASLNELDEITGWANHHILNGKPVLVFCREGRGRSAMVAVACLVRLGLPISEAHSILMRTRPTAVLSNRQMIALEAFAESIQTTNAA